MVRGFFAAHAQQLERHLTDAVLMFERWHWTLEDVERLDWDDFVLLSEAVHDINRREAEAYKQARSK